MSLNISKAELEVLHVLWEAETPLHRSGILENSKDKTWKDSYIHILLNKMLEKGFIKEAGFTRSGKVWARLYEPSITLEDYYTDVLLAGGFDPIAIIRAMFKTTEIDRETINALRDMVDQAGAEIEAKDA